MPVERALLVIADTGGYTRFMKLHRTSLAHSQDITGRLLEAVVDAAPPLMLVEIEGDAAFLYLPHEQNGEASASKAAADETDAGIASAINNAIARVAGLVGVSVMGVVVASTLTADTFAANGQSVRAFHQAIVICAALVAFGGIAGGLGISNPRRTVRAEQCPGGQFAGVPEPAVDRA